MGEVPLYVGGRGPHDTPKGVEGEYEALGQLGQNEPASGCRWSHCLAGLRPHSEERPDARLGTPTRGPARRRTHSEQISNLLATDSMQHQHHGRNEFRVLHHVLIQRYLAHKKPPAPLGPL